MAGVRIRGSVVVQYRGVHIVLDVTRADMLEELALDVLVLDLGTEGARKVLAKSFLGTDAAMQELCMSMERLGGNYRWRISLLGYNPQL